MNAEATRMQDLASEFPSPASGRARAQVPRCWDPLNFSAVVALLGMGGKFHILAL